MLMPVLLLCVLHALQVRVVNGVPPTGDYSFAKYNKVLQIDCHLSHLLSFFNFTCMAISIHLFGMLQSVDVVKYTDEEYEKYLTDPVGINSRFNLVHYQNI